MAELIDQFWEPDTTPDNDCHKIGAIFQAPVNYVDRHLQVLRVTYVDPYHRRPPMLQLGQADDSTFNHQPVVDLKLKSNEAYVAYKAKKRPLVLFSMPTGPRPDIAGGSQDGSFLCL